MTTPTPYWRSPDGSVTLYCGDCLNILPTFDDGEFDAVVTDPPYGIGVGSAFVMQGGAVVENGAGTFNENASWAWLRSPTWLRAGGNVAAFYKQGDSLPDSVRSWHRFYIVKDAPPPTPRPVFVSAVEECSIGSTPGPRRWFGGGYTPNYWRGLTPNRLNADHGHPSEKPVGAILILIESLSARGDLVADPFTGSGTTGVACVRTGRRFVGIEIDEGYCEIARKRIQQAFDDQGLFRQGEQHAQLELMQDTDE